MLQQFYPQVNHNFTYELNKDMNFAAAHYIPHNDAGACSQIHGHTYFANVTVGGDQLDHMGFLINFQAIKKAVHKRYDHTLMNNHDEFAIDLNSLVHGVPAPSTEVVAEAIYNLIQEELDKENRGLQCLQVVLRETPTSYVIYRPKKH